MNKRGFTLIEMIAVIVLLSLMAIIVETNITKIVKRSKSVLSATQEKLVIQFEDISIFLLKLYSFLVSSLSPNINYII